MEILEFYVIIKVREFQIEGVRLPSFIGILQRGCPVVAHHNTPCRLGQSRPQHHAMRLGLDINWHDFVFLVQKVSLSPQMLLVLFRHVQAAIRAGGRAGEQGQLGS